MKIMIVDDNRNIREVMKSTVTRRGDEICECENARSAIALYKTFQPDWVLMDVEMEGTDGITATREMLRVDSKARVIIVTQYDEVHFRIAAEDAGAVAFVSKENLHELNRIIHA
ncbi:MAG TPA: response regulator [Candidatus Kryptonia bacterium]